jgi:hypothetical protein
VERCEKYSNYKNYLSIPGDSMDAIIFEEIHDFIKDKFNYVTHYYNSSLNIITKIPLLDSTNLKKLLNQKP